MSNKVFALAFKWLDRRRARYTVTSADQIARIHEMIDFLRDEAQDWSATKSQVYGHIGPFAAGGRTKGARPACRCPPRALYFLPVPTAVPRESLRVWRFFSLTP